MARIGIDFNAVAKAATEIQGQGHHPTVDRVREQLGRGSRTTINRHLRDWRNQQQAAVTPLPAHLVDAVNTLYATLQAKATARIEAARNAAEALRVELLDEVALAQDKAATLAGELEAMADAKNTVTTTLAEKTDAFNQLQTDHRSLTQQHHVLAAQCEGLQQQLADKTALLATMTQQMSHFEQSISEARHSEKQQYQSEKALLQAHIKQLTTQQHQQRQSLAQRLKAHQRQWQQEKRTLTTTLSQQQSQIAATDQQQQQLAYQLAVSQEDNLRLTQAIAQQDKTLATQQAEVLTHQETIKRHMADIRRLDKVVQQLEKYIHLLEAKATQHEGD